jgi:nitroimidazol reductase NimA-like FMN-containing flavoprotein (pyridoxamine 5'-phosphate oxidase superfamily)
MTSGEIRRFLLHGTRTAKVATVMADGAPHLAPVWFVLDGERVVFTTGASSVKGRNLRRDPRIALAVGEFSERCRVASTRQGQQVFGHDRVLAALASVCSPHAAGGGGMPGGRDP